MHKLALGAAALLAAGSAQAASTLTSLTNWNGSTGYVNGAPVVASKVVYGVLGYPSAVTGSVYALTPPASGTIWTKSTLASFSGGTAGGYPIGALVADSSGNLYGATYGGGSTSTTCKNTGYAGCGTIYKLAKPASGSTWTRTTLYTFTGGTDGIGPLGSLVINSAGVLFGVTQWGGCTPTLTYGYGCGTVFKLTPPATGKTAWTYAQLYKFQGGATDGATPAVPLALDSAGNIYGTTRYGGVENCTTLSGSPDGRCGTVFKLALSGTTYTESLLHSFTDGTDGSIPAGGVVLDSSGNVYGTTLQGGNNSGLCLNFGYSGCGQVFELAKPTSGTSWTKTALLNFKGTDGATPSALLRDSAGNLFGATAYNTTADTACTLSYYCGTVFKAALSGTTWTETVLYSFTGASSIADPEFGLAVDTAGLLYAVTEYNVTSTVVTLGGSGYGPRRTH
jgi:uncharacterized protein YceK